MNPLPRKTKTSQYAIWPLLTVIGIFLYLTATIIFIQYGQLNADEGWYLYASQLVYNKQLPYQDFAFTQPPLLPYLYGIPQNLLSPSLLLGRLTSVALATTAFIFALLIANKHSKKPAVALTALLWATFTYGIYFHTVTKTYALVTLCFMAVFYTLCSQMDNQRKYLIATLFSLLAIITRLTALSFAVFIILYALIKTNNRTRLLIVTLCLLATGWMAYLILPNVEAAQWNLIEHHILQWGDLSYVQRIRGIITARIPSLFHVFAGQAILIVSLIVIGNRRLLTVIKDNSTLSLILIALIAFAGPHLVSGGFHHEYFVPFFLTLLPCVAILFVKIYEHSQKPAQYLLQLAFVASLVTGIVIGGLRFIDTSGGHPPIAEIRILSDVIAQNSNDTDEILALEALWVAIEANRQTLPNFTLAQFSLTFYDTEQATRLNLVNPDIILDHINAQTPKFIVLTELDWQFLEISGQSEAIYTALGQNYTLIMEQTEFGQKKNRVELYQRQP